MLFASRHPQMPCIAGLSVSLPDGQILDGHLDGGTATTSGRTHKGEFVTKLFARVLILVLAFSVLATSSVVTAATCTSTGYVKDSRDLTAAQIGGDVTGTLDATGCDIGVYYAPGTRGTVNNADIFGATYYGVLANGADVNVLNSQVHNIGNTPFDGSQHGVGILYINGASGLIDGNSVYQYQKGGIVVTGTGTTATVTNNDVRGLGPVDFIAQNGIQVSRGAVATVRGNTISDNFYTGHVGVGPNPGGQNPPGWEYFSAGLLLFQAGDGTKASNNHFSGNEHNLAQVP